MTVWEIAIKGGARTMPPRPDLPAELLRVGFAELPVTWEHAGEVASLPLHHRDPFDRLLIAQALVEGLRIVTRDPTFAQYNVPVLAA